MIVEIKQKKPKGFENVTEVVNIRSPLAKDLKGLDFTKDTTNSMIILLSRCTDLTEEAVENLEAAEFLKLSNALNKYLEP